MARKLIGLESEVMVFSEVGPSLKFPFLVVLLCTTGSFRTREKSCFLGGLIILLWIDIFRLRLPYLLLFVSFAFLLYGCLSGLKIKWIWEWELFELKKKKILKMPRSPQRFLIYGWVGFLGMKRAVISKLLSIHA